MSIGRDIERCRSVMTDHDESEFANAFGRVKRTCSYTDFILRYLLHCACGRTMHEIASVLSVDRTTVMHAIHRTEDARDDPAFDALIGQMEQALKASAA